MDKLINLSHTNEQDTHMYTRHYDTPLTYEQIHDRLNAIAQQDNRNTDYMYHNVDDEKYFMIVIRYCFDNSKWYMSCYCSDSPCIDSFYYTKPTTRNPFSVG